MTGATLGGVLAFIIIELWLFQSHKLGHHLKNNIIIVVDSLAFLMFCVAKVELYKKIIIIVAMFWMSLLWILWENYRKKEISLQGLKESRLDDLCFGIGIVIIIVFLVRMLFGEVDF